MNKKYILGIIILIVISQIMLPTMKIHNFQKTNFIINYSNNNFIQLDREFQNIKDTHEKIKIAKNILKIESNFGPGDILSAVNYLQQIDGKNNYYILYNQNEKNRIYNTYINALYKKSVIDFSSINNRFLIYDYQELRDYFEQYFYQTGILGKKLNITFYPTLKNYKSMKIIKLHQSYNQDFSTERKLFLKNEN